MPRASNTAIVVVPGAFHVPYHFNLLKDKLTTAGYVVDVLHLPSVSEHPPKTAFTEDVETIQKAIQKHITAGKDVALVAHSYGGIPLTEAALNHEEKIHSQHGVITNLIYVCAFMLVEGESIVKVPVELHMVANRDEKNGSILRARSPRDEFYNDVPDDIAESAIAHLLPMALGHGVAAPSRCAWRRIPTGYIFCEKDNAIPLDAQKFFVNRAREQGVDVETVALDASHSPFLSMPQETAEAIEKLLARA